MLIMLESSTSVAGKVKESDTSRQLTEDDITELDSDALFLQRHALHITMVAQS